MKAHCNYEVMCQLVNDKLFPQPRHAECPYPFVSKDSGQVIFKGYNAETNTVYTPGTCAKLDDGRGFFHGSFKLLKWAEEIAVANGLTIAFDVLPSPPPQVKKTKPQKAVKTKPTTVAAPVERKPLSLQEIMAAKRAAK